MNDEQLTKLAQQVYEWRHARRAPPLEALFYPYTNLNHSVRLRSGKVLLRISDIMADAPAWALRAIIEILFLKLDRRRITPQLSGTYRIYAESPATRARIHQVRQNRGRKMLGSQNGRFFDLQETFDRLNRQYFHGAVEVSALSWSQRKTRRILGHYDRCHNVIVISRSLDTQRVPRLLFEFILFHEMLHAHAGEQYHNGRRYAHHWKFQMEEKRFERYREAQELMRQFSARIG